MTSLLLSLIPVIFGVSAVTAIFFVIRHYIKKGKKAMRQLFGTDNLQELILSREEAEQNTPKSLAGMTNVYAPLIQKDFPELNLHELRSTAEDHLQNFLFKKHYTNVLIHQTVIREYIHKSGTCTIIFQSAVALMDQGKKRQTRFNIIMLYVQDMEKYRETTGVGLTCPNCGGSISMLGAKHCIYCGSAVIPINMNVWELDKIEEDL